MVTEETVSADSEAEMGRHRIQEREALKIAAVAKRWWRRSMASTVDQVDVIRRTKEECDLQGRYIFMTSMSAGIAVLGLILSSPAVVIGAMLLSPLMGPIIGSGFAIAIWDVKWLRESGRTLFFGVIAAILIAAFITAMSPIQNVTPEIASRTRPSLLDLAVALFSALAGAYAMIRGRAGTIVGVAIAVALMPPLAVVGFGLATLNWTVFGGALMLFITNLVTIAAAAAVMARIYGFRTSLSKKRSRIQSVVIALVLLLLAVPLYFSLGQIAWEARATRQVSQVLAREFDSQARLEAPNIDFDADTVRVTATIFTSKFHPEAESRASRALSEQLEKPFDVQLEQVLVSFDPGAAEAAELAAARNREQAEAIKRRIDELENRLALVAGVSTDDVLIDRDQRRALAKARPLDGASLAAYRELEARVQAGVPEWQVRIVPPARPLPVISFGVNGEPNAQAIQLVAWAVERIGAPIRLTGSEEATTKTRDALVSHGVSSILVEAGSGDEVRVSWAAADATN